MGVREQVHTATRACVVVVIIMSSSALLVLVAADRLCLLMCRSLLLCSVSGNSLDADATSALAAALPTLSTLESLE